MTGASIYDNASQGDAGGVYCRGSIFMSSGKVTGNNADGNGGGLYRENSSNDNGDYGYGSGSRTGGTLGGSGSNENYAIYNGNNTYGFGSKSYRWYYRTSSFSGTSKSETVYYYDMPSPVTSSPSGYSFAYWSTSSSSTSTSYMASDAPNRNMSTSGSSTYYAVYRKTLYLYINEYVEAGSYYGVYNYSYNQTTSQSKTVSISLQIPDGYTFAGLTTTDTTIDYNYNNYTIIDGMYYYQDTTSTYGVGTTTAPTFYTTSSTSITLNNAGTYLYAVYKKEFVFNISSSSTHTATVYYGYNVNTTIYRGTSHYGSDTKSYTYNATRSGYNFEGWSTSRYGTSATSATVSSSSSSSSYYAVWSRTLTLKHYYRTSTASYTTSNTLTCTYNGSISSITTNVTSVTPTLIGFTFYGWATSSIAEGTSTTPTTYTSRTISVSAANTTSSLYAVWQRQVQYYYDGTNTTTYRYYPYNTSTGTKYISISNSTPTGYNLYGYTITSSFTNNTTTAPSLVSYSGNVYNIATTSVSSTVYAVYSRTWDFYETTTERTTKYTYYNYLTEDNATYELTYDATRTGYFLEGWAMNSMETVVASGGATVSTDYASSTWFAVWYKELILNHYYGVTSYYISTKKELCLYTGSIDSISSPVTTDIPVKSGFDFYGWTKDSLNEGATILPTIYIAVSQATPNAITTVDLYATWGKKISYYHNATNDVTYRYYPYTTAEEIKYIYLPTDVPEGYSFSGYTTDISFTNNTTLSPDLVLYSESENNIGSDNSNMTIYAVYKRLWHFNEDEETTYDISSYYMYDVVANEEYAQSYTPSKDNYTFAGWTIDPQSTQPSSDSNVSLTTNSGVWYAVWADASGTREDVQILTHTFYTASETSNTDTTTKTTSYIQVTVYYNYSLSKTRTATSGGTAGDSTYSKLEYQSASMPEYIFVGWTQDSASASATWTSGDRTPVDNESWYAVWRSNSQQSEIVDGSPDTGVDTFTLIFDGNNSTGGSTDDMTGTIIIDYDRERLYYLQYNYDLSESIQVDESFGSNYESGRTYPTLTLPSNGFIRTGYTFTTWALGGGTGTTYAVGSTYTPTSGTSATMYAVWDANDYILTFNANGGTLSGNETYIVTYDSTNYNSMSSIIPTREGYTFIGWYTDATAGEQVYDTNGQAVEGTYWAASGSSMIWNYAGDVTLYAHWAPATYNVTTGMSAGTASVTVADTGTYGEGLSISWTASENTAQYTYTLDYVRVYAGTDTSGTLLATYTSGTSATYVMNGTYYPNIYIYATHTATVNRYNVTIVSNNTTYGTVSVGQVNVPYGSVVQADGNIITIGSETVTATVKTGYHFVSWTIPANTVTGAMTITAVFAPDTDTAYTVRHYWQNVDDDEYTLHETENLTGTTGAQVTPSVKTYTGFNSPSTQTVTVAADGSTVVEYRYTRQTYTVNLQTGTGVTSVSGGGTYRYEKEITINAVLAEGYDWRNWTGTTTISTQQATITVTQNMTLTANADIKVLVVTITAGTGGQVSETSVEVDYGTAVSVDGATLTIGTTVVTATANSGYEFDSYLNVPETVTSNVTITAQFAEIVNVTIEVQGEVGSGSFGIKVNNGETISTSGTVRKGSTINIVGTTEPGDEENNVYQIVTVYINDELSMRPDTGDISGNTGTIIYSVEEDTTIRFVFSEGYRMNISATEDTNVDGIDISADIDKITADGVIATDAEVTITIDENTLKGSNTDRTYIGMIYTLESGETVSRLNDGADDNVVGGSVGDGLFVYTVKENVIIEDIHVIVKGTETINIEIPVGKTVEIRSADEGFVRNLQNGENTIFTGKWYIMLPIDAESIETIFSGYEISQETTGAYEGYYYFEL